MKRKYLIFVAVLTACLSASAGNLDKVREAFAKASLTDFSLNTEMANNFIRYSDDGTANDMLMFQLYMAVKLPEETVDALMADFDLSKGQWKDIDYSSQNRGRWPTALHLSRVQALAKLYCDPASSHYKSKEFHDLIHSALGWWFSEKPVNPNWWHNNIGVPRRMGVIMLLLRDELSEEEVEGALRVMSFAKFGMTGQNRAWLAGANIMKGLFLDDEELVRKAIAEIDDEIRVTDKEGIQMDWSFHQHGPQIQLGNYGLAFADNCAFWIRVLKDTEYQFAPEKVEIVKNYIKNGLAWSFWRGMMDPSFCARQVFPDAGRGKAYAFAVVANNMAEALDDDSFRQIQSNNLLPEQNPNQLVGSVFFPKSDCGIYRAKDWYASIRMHSQRTIGFEYTNNENTLANFSADGALLTMRSSEEYENIFAIWDWRRIPGVTAYEDGLPLPKETSSAARLNNSSHVGGLADADVMAATMELSRGGLHALKSVFFFPDVVVALGSDISSSRETITKVTTGVEQNRLKGSVKQGKGWVWHDNSGYVSLDGATLNVTTSLQSGNWGPIDPFLTDRNDSGEVFKCWLDHGSLKDGCGSYAYAILPSIPASKVAGWARKPKVKVLANTHDCQAVKNGESICIVFHSAGSVRDGGRTLTADHPCIMILRGDSKKEYPL